VKRTAGILFGTLAAFWSCAASAQCVLPTGWTDVVDKQAHYVVFGEMHGTSEGPVAFGGVACALAQQDKRLLVAVELDDNLGLQRAWAAPHERFATALLEALPEWKTRNDGVTSQSMLNMLVALHGLKDAGRKIDVVAFNDTEQLESSHFKGLPGQGPHEAGQAENIRAADAQQPYDHVLVLVGNYHARKRPIAPGGVSYEPMAMRLADAARIVSISMTNDGGQMWACQLKKGFTPMQGPISAAMVECGPHDLKGTKHEAGVPQIVATHGASGPDNPDASFDATFNIGRVTASPPAKLPE
jgi:hypothetical protein